MVNIDQVAGIAQKFIGEGISSEKTQAIVEKALPMVIETVKEAFSESPKPQKQEHLSPEAEKRQAVSREFATEEHLALSAKEKESFVVPGALRTAFQVGTAPIAFYAAFEGAGILLYIASCLAILRGVAAFYTSGLSESIIPGVTKKLTELADKLANELPGPAKQILEKTKAYDYIKKMANVDLAGLKECLGDLPKLFKEGNFFEGENPTHKDLLSFESFSKFLQNAKLSEAGKAALNTATEKFKEKVPAPEMAEEEMPKPL